MRLLLRLFPALLFILMFSSCARVGSPVGGAKDTIPPRVTGSNIDSPRVNVPRDIRELRINFDEYVSLKDINRQLIISPPLRKITKILPSSIANKYLLIKWEDTLQENTTYNFNFGNAIVDQNEGNPLSYYNFAFSTGPSIDSLYISGDVKKIIESKEASASDKSVVIGLYRERDSMDYRQKPYYITKADEDGYFELNYLSPGNYRLLAFEDANTNSVYDAGTESVAFLDKSLSLEQSISGLQLNLFPSRKSNRYIEMKEMPGGILMTFEGNPDTIKVASLTDNLREYRVSHRPKSDSVYIWFNALQQQLGTERSENLKFSYDNGVKQDTVSLFYRYNTKNEMTLSNARGNLLAPNQEFIIKSNYEINELLTSQWTLVSDSIQQNFTAQVLPENPFEIHVKSDFKEGKKYALTITSESVVSFYEKNSKAYRFEFEADKTQNYGDLTITLSNAPAEKFWLQLITGSGDVAYSLYGKETLINFKSLKPGKYRIRMLVDENENGIWDVSDFANGIFAEPVHLFSKTIEVRPLWEIRENWDLQAESGTNMEKTPLKTSDDTTPQ